MTTDLASAPRPTVALTKAQLARLERGLPVRLAVTEEAFLAYWPTTRFRAEYFNNELTIMGLAAFIHEVIVMNIGQLLARFYTPANGFFVAGSNVGLKVPSHTSYVNPDITVVQGKPVFVGSSKAILTNPYLLVEVLSASTAEYDLNEKLLRYQQLTSLRVVLFVDYPEKAVYVATPTDTPKVWTFTTYTEPNEQVRFEAHTIPFSEFFANLPDVD